MKLMTPRLKTAIIYDEDKDLGEVELIGTSPGVSEYLPTQKIDPDKLKRLSAQQRKELLSVLDNTLNVFRINLDYARW